MTSAYFAYWIDAGQRTRLIEPVVAWRREHLPAERSVFKRIARANMSGEMARCPRYTGLDPAVVELLDEYGAFRDQSLSLGCQSRSLIGALSAI